jgi:drug/metabolite transporter superfamily protein YnfA
LATYGGVFAAESLDRGTALDGFRLDRCDVIGTLVPLARVWLIMSPFALGQI